LFATIDNERNFMPNGIIKKTIPGSDNKLPSEEYIRIDSNSDHIDNLIEMVSIQPNKRYLDLGTGKGYIAFELADRFPEISVTGLDIASNCIQQDEEIRQKRQISNLSFKSYDGIRLPFDNNSFAGVFSRFAFHHLHDEAFIVNELNRVLEPGGFVVVADPVTFNEDKLDFIDRFQKLTLNGHVHFYRQSELNNLFAEYGFEKGKSFRSRFTYPRSYDEAYKNLIKNTSKSILEKYKVSPNGSIVNITVEVLNTLFKKPGK
jgi:ubiquinone/menaquinone biosynthesis C-methylase UbiE